MNFREFIIEDVGNLRDLPKKWIKRIAGWRDGGENSEMIEELSNTTFNAVTTFLRKNSERRDIIAVVLKEDNEYVAMIEYNAYDNNNKLSILDADGIAERSVPLKTLKDRINFDGVIDLYTVRVDEVRRQKQADRNGNKPVSTDYSNLPTNKKAISDFIHKKYDKQIKTLMKDIKDTVKVQETLLKGDLSDINRLNSGDLSRQVHKLESLIYDIERLVNSHGTSKYGETSIYNKDIKKDLTK